MHQDLGQFPVLEEVELKPKRIGGNLGHFLNAVAGGGAEPQDGPRASGGPGGSQLAHGVGPLVSAGGGQHHRHAYLFAQDRGGHVPFGDVHQNPGTQFDIAHGLDVGGVGYPVRCTQVAEQPVEQGSGHGLPGPGFVVSNGQQGGLSGHASSVVDWLWRSGVSSPTRTPLGLPGPAERCRST